MAEILEHDLMSHFQGATIHTSEGLLIDVVPRNPAASSVPQGSLQYHSDASSNGAYPASTSQVAIPAVPLPHLP